jgi:pimeloyl-ACP methyl ester carboxylesterase
VLFLIHGLGHWTQAAWDAMAMEFLPTHRVVALDLPGFGASGKPRGHYTLGFFSSVLERVAGSLDLPRFALVGHSLGGAVAAEYAGRHPDRLRMLGLIAPAAFRPTLRLAVRFAVSRPLIWLAGAARPPRSLLRRTFELAVYDRAVVSEPDVARAYEIFGDPAAGRAYFRVYADSTDALFRPAATRARFARWHGPTALVWGREDRFVPIRALADARRVYPQASVLELERCGHCPQLEHPLRVARHLLSAGA